MDSKKYKSNRGCGATFFSRAMYTCALLHVEAGQLSHHGRQSNALYLLRMTNVTGNARDCLAHVNVDLRMLRKRYVAETST